MTLLRHNSDSTEMLLRYTTTKTLPRRCNETTDTLQKRYRNATETLRETSETLLWRCIFAKNTLRFSQHRCLIYASKSLLTELLLRVASGKLLQLSESSSEIGVFWNGRKVFPWWCSWKLSLCTGDILSSHFPHCAVFVHFREASKSTLRATVAQNRK